MDKVAVLGVFNCTFVSIPLKNLITLTRAPLISPAPHHLSVNIDHSIAANEGKGHMLFGLPNKLAVIGVERWVHSNVVLLHVGKNLHQW